MKSVLLMLTLFISVPALATIEARFVPNPVAQGKSVEFVLSSDKPFQGVPNIEILQKDFLIGGQQKRQSSRWVNGQGSTSYELAYTLFPNKAGQIVVQDLKIGSEAIPVTTLTVSSNGSKQAAKSLTLTIQCSKNPVYPLQKITCATILDDEIGITNGQIVPPKTTAGTWEQINTTQPIGTTNNSRRYRTDFTFSPTQSGTIQMDPFVFQGEAILDTRPANTQYRSILDFMIAGFGIDATQPVMISSDPFTIFVKEKPAQYQGWWLPSPNVTLTETYQMPDQIAVGEPITRTLILRATNVLAAQMPVPTAPQTEHIKVYANPEKRADTAKGGEVQVEMTFVPTQPGEITLPQIQVPWFNSTTEKIETASVPAKQIFVVGEATSQPQQTTPAIQPTQPKTQPVVADTSAIQKGLSLGWVIALMVGAFAFGLGLAILILWRVRRNSVKHDKKKPLPDLYPF